MLAITSRPLLARRGTQRVLGQRRTAVRVQSLMGSYRYKTRVARLREHGAHVHDFGDRTLYTGSYGDDVMALQAYLTEQGYFNSADGLSGYFGAVTREALQNWQRDHGLRANGVWNEECKWTYLRQLESAAQAGTMTAMGPAQAMAATPAYYPSYYRTASHWGQMFLDSGLLGVAAVAAGVALATSKLLRRDDLLAVARAAGAALMGAVQLAVATVAAVTAATLRALHVLLLPDMAIGSSAGAAERAAAAAAAAAAAKVAAAKAAAAAPDAAPAGATSAAALAEQEEAAYRAAMAQMPPQQGPRKPKRLSDEEVQQRIAVMKGEVSPRTPVPQRPAPRVLPLGIEKPANDPIVGSKYGTYYGGRQVRDKVKQYLEQDTGISHSRTPFDGPAARRLQSMGYQMSNLLRRATTPTKPSSSSKPAPASSAAAPAQLAAAPQPAAAAPAPEAAPAPAAASAAAAVVPAATEPFQDVAEPAAAGAATAPVPAQKLLTGTELEKAPEKRGRPVPVVKPGMASPAPAALAEAQPSAAQQAPRPVPVVKPQKRATIGDMLRASRNGGEEYEPPTAALYPGGGGFGFAPVPPSGRAAQPRQPYPATPSSSSSSYPVKTGSSYSGGPDVEAAAAGAAPVLYNPDGSVVLSSKPIKLVKPARLLPKTYGFEAMAPEEPLAEQGEQYTSLSAREQFGDDAFGGYRPRDN